MQDITILGENMAKVGTSMLWLLGVGLFLISNQTLGCQYVDKQIEQCKMDLICASTRGAIEDRPTAIYSPLKARLDVPGIKAFLETLF